MGNKTAYEYIKEQNSKIPCDEWIDIDVEGYEWGQTNSLWLFALYQNSNGDWVNFKFNVFKKRPTVYGIKSSEINFKLLKDYDFHMVCQFRRSPKGFINLEKIKEDSLGIWVDDIEHTYAELCEFLDIINTAKHN